MRINTLSLYDNPNSRNATPKMLFCQYDCKADFCGSIYLSIHGLIYLSAIVEYSFLLNLTYPCLADVQSLRQLSKISDCHIPPKFAALPSYDAFMT